MGARKEREMTPNDPKLSDCEAGQDACMAGLPGAGGMPSVAVRCSAWLGDVGQLGEKLQSIVSRGLDLVVGEHVIRKIKTKIVPGIPVSGNANNIRIQRGKYGC